jgi:hypothetical protein
VCSTTDSTHSTVDAGARTSQPVVFYLGFLASVSLSLGRMGRAPCCEKVGLKRGRWTREEDAVLARYIREHGEGAWRSLPKNAGTVRLRHP